MNYELFFIQIDPIVRRLFGNQYRLWNGIKSRSGSPQVMCQRCRRVIDKRIEPVYVRRFRAGIDFRIRREYLCGDCLERKNFRRISKYDFHPERW